MFLVYINDIFSVADVELRLLADDACLGVKHSDHYYIVNVVNKELSKVDKWLCNNILFIDCTKTKFCFLVQLLRNANLVL